MAVVELILEVVFFPLEVTAGFWVRLFSRQLFLVEGDSDILKREVMCFVAGIKSAPSTARMRCLACTRSYFPMCSSGKGL